MLSEMCKREHCHRPICARLHVLPTDASKSRSISILTVRCSFQRVFCRCFCSPSETYGRKWDDSNLQNFTELPVPPQAAGVIGTFLMSFFIYYYYFSVSGQFEAAELIRYDPTPTDVGRRTYQPWPCYKVPMSRMYS